MKKLLSFIVVLAVLFTLSPAVLAADTTTDDLHALYEEYGQIISSANKLYGLSLYLLPFDEIEDFCSPEEFRTSVVNYIEYREAPLTTTGNEMNTVMRGTGSQFVTNVKTRDYYNDRVTITFQGNFDVKYASGYYISYMHFNVLTQSRNGSVAFNLKGDVSTSTTDGGRTIRATQVFAVTVLGQFAEDVSVSASFYMSPATGTITALTNN